MTIKEITALRKAGHIDEALNEAEALYAQNQNNYTAGALFWCLNEQGKRQEDEGELRVLYERMKQLYEAHCPSDTFMPNSLAAIERKQLKHSAELRDAIAAAKDGGDARGLCRAFCGYYEEGDLPDALHADYGWLIYYALKQTVEVDARESKQLLLKYLKLGLERPSILHSLILSEAIKLKQGSPMNFRFGSFMDLWGFENLRDEDWEQFRIEDGKTMPSLVEKTIGVYAKELKTDWMQPSEDYCKVLDKALDRYSNNQNMPYYKATLLVSQGMVNEAVRYYRDLILKSPSKSYLWTQLSAIVDDLDTRIALLCKAVNTGEEGTFLGGARLRLAHSLIDKGRFAEAKMEIEQYRLTYEKQRWRLKQEYWDVFNRIPSDTTAVECGMLYAEYTKIADSFIYEGLPGIYAVKVSDRQLDDKRHEGRKFVQWTLKAADKQIYLKKPRKYGLDTRMPNGTVLEVKMLGDRIVWIKAVAAIPKLEWLRSVTGKVSIRLDRNGKRYTIIKHVYVGASLLENVTDGDIISVTAVRGTDGRWTAVSTGSESEPLSQHRR